MLLMLLIIGVGSEFGMDSIAYVLAIPNPVFLFGVYVLLKYTLRRPVWTVLATPSNSSSAIYFPQKRFVVLHTAESKWVDCEPLRTDEEALVGYLRTCLGERLVIEIPDAECPVDQILGAPEEMDPRAIVDTVREVLARQMDMPEDQLRDDATLPGDLTGDAPDIADLLAALEYECGCELPWSEARNIKTLKDLSDFVQSRWLSLKGTASPNVWDEPKGCSGSSFPGIQPPLTAAFAPASWQARFPGGSDPGGTRPATEKGQAKTWGKGLILRLIMAVGGVVLAGYLITWTWDSPRQGHGRPKVQTFEGKVEVGHVKSSDPSESGMEFISCPYLRTVNGDIYYMWVRPNKTKFIRTGEPRTGSAIYLPQGFVAESDATYRAEGEVLDVVCGKLVLDGREVNQEEFRDKRISLQASDAKPEVEQLAAQKMASEVPPERRGRKIRFLRVDCLEKVAQ